MKRLRRACVLAAILAGSSSLAAIGAATPKPPRALDRDLLDRVLEQSSVERSMPDPSWGAYVADVSRHFGHRLVQWLERTGLPTGEVLRWVGWLVIGAVLLLLLVAAGDLLSRQRDRAPKDDHSVGLPPGNGAEPTLATAHADPWTAYRRRFESGRLREALEALWWAVVEVYAEGRATHSWTTNDVLRAAPEPSLRPLLATLDRLRFAADAATPEEVARLARALEESTA